MGVYEDMANDAGYRFGSAENAQMANDLQAQHERELQEQEEREQEERELAAWQEKRWMDEQMEAAQMQGAAGVSEAIAAQEADQSGGAAAEQMKDGEAAEQKRGR